MFKIPLRLRDQLRLLHFGQFFKRVAIWHPNSTAGSEHHKSGPANTGTATDQAINLRSVRLMSRRVLEIGVLPDASITIALVHADGWGSGGIDGEGMPHCERY
jgi:hypothetical protein